MYACNLLNIKILTGLRHTRSKASAPAITNDDELKLLESLENGTQSNSIGN
jgi:hypothetical protein